MSDREKLIELLENYPHDYIYKYDLADYLLENGVILPARCNEGELQK